MNKLGKIVAGIAVFGIVIQAVPFGRDHTNPPVTQEPAWDSPGTRELAVRACYDCHSNQTRWPWYSNIAPVSWLTQRDVNGGRRHLNFSEFTKPQKNQGRAGAEVQSGDMPPWFFLPMHPEARLTSAEKDTLIAGLNKTLGTADNRPKGR